MYDDLSRIERCYGSVAEYNRSRLEDEEYEMEIQMKTNEQCWKNRQKLEDNADIAVYFSDECIEKECEHYEDIGPRFWNAATMDVDDVEHGLCHNCNRKECEVWKSRNE